MDDKLMPGIAWFAGLFDGEGCIAFGRHPSPIFPTFHLHVTVGNTFGAAVQLFAHRWGGTVKCFKEDTRNRKRKFYLWQLSGKVARTALTEMLPHLVIKADQAQTVLNYYALPWRGQGRKRTASNYAIDKSHDDRLRDLKRFTPAYSWERPI